MIQVGSERWKNSYRMTSVKHEPIKDLVVKPPAGSRGRAVGQGTREAGGYLALGHPKEEQYLSILCILQIAQKPPKV